ncbi:Transcription initiation factor TFIID subunit 12 [Toensbergia leucococca]|nr:Transcription initiation factor TFIID subunit 12 [Toensbergia leucococca]
MSNLANPPVHQGLPPLSSLIRPEMVAKLPHVTDQQKANYAPGIMKLWDTIHTRPHDSPEHQAAHKKLADVTASIKAGLRKHSSEQQARDLQASQQNGTRPINQAQPTQIDSHQQNQPIHPNPGQNQTHETVTPKILTAVQNLELVTPPNVRAQGPQSAQNWQREARNKYAHHLQRLELATQRMNEVNQTIAQNQREGKVDASLNDRKGTYQRTIEEAKVYLGRFKQQQQQLREQNNQSQAASNGVPGFPTSRDATGQVQNVHQVSQQHMPLDGQGQPHTVNSAVDAARNQANLISRSAMSPSNSGQPGHQQMSQAPASQIQHAASGSQGQPQAPHPPLNISTSSGPSIQQRHSPQASQPQSTTNSQGPHPLSHRAAVEQAAQSYSQTNYQQSTPQSSTYPQTQLGNREPQNNNIKMPIPKTLNVPQPQQVTMGPARPSLSGGPSNSAMGSLGQPGIQKHPGYVLEGEGERVLSKKKLEELVRQVTGGGESEEGEGLTAEVEETLLQVADDFVDQVIVSACKLAKLRQSSTLELRDIQLILERNYNIRVPGYASDELRTVKKIQPTQAWTQKISAVQAAKVTGGKPDA